MAQETRMSRYASGDAIFEIETDKVVCEVEATADGVLREMCFSEGANVNVGAAVAVIDKA